MSEQPKRRWFQLRLSTWLVLVGILAWAMALKPAADWGYARVNYRGEPEWHFHIDGYRMSTSIMEGWPRGGKVLALELSFSRSPNQDVLWFRTTPVAVVFPALALITLLSWKGYWLWRERRRSGVTRAMTRYPRWVKL